MWNTKLVRGEMLRKLSRFDEAEKQFEELTKEPTVKKLPVFAKTDGLELERQLKRHLFASGKAKP